ncbi:SGNH hydrolase domain-containing protein, partial [Neisseria sp. P0004.S009]|uniref:SGNH hydrolase domain-containing protein n=1 Tax=Neisseria sp. P0004.S009 TaxID=3436673 RepID=UPI003F81C1CB
YEANLYTVDEFKICAYTCTNTDCAVGAENQSSKVLLMVDSHAAHLTPFIDIVGKQEGFAADIISSNSCGVAFGFLL